MDANPPTTADFAASDARAAQLSTQDCLVLIGWLSDRVAQLEALTQEYRIPMPRLPSAMSGFACLPKRDEAVSSALKRMRQR